MNKIFAILIILMALTACSAFPTQVVPEKPATDTPIVNMPNPASVFCIQNGNKNEIVTAEDGSQYGICNFPDGSSCEEWAYYRGECGPASQASPTPEIVVEETVPVVDDGTEEVIDWWGVIKSSEPGSQFDDYFERQDSGQVILYGIDSIDSGIKSQIETLRDSGKIVHLYGILLSDLPDINGMQIQPDRIEVEE